MAFRARLEADRAAAQAESAGRSLALLKGEELLTYGQDGAALAQIAAFSAQASNSAARS